MFLSLKDKFINVTKNVGLTTAGHQQEDAKKVPVDVNASSGVSYSAGAGILNHFQQQWAEMHELNEENAKNAAIAAEIVDSLHSRVTKDHENLNTINNVLSATNNISKTVDNCVVKLTELHFMFGTVEKALIDLEDLIEKFELQEKQIEHKFQLALYKEKKLAHLDNVRSTLATQHSQSVRNFELKQQKTLQERQQVFQEAFKSDLETFKSLGTIPKIESPSRQPSALLEEIQIESDETELEKFLEK